MEKLEKSEDKGFVTKGTAEYFADRNAKIEARIVEATTQIATIEGRMRAELEQITALRNALCTHLNNFIAARNALVGRSRNRNEQKRATSCAKRDWSCGRKPSSTPSPTVSRR